MNEDFLQTIWDQEQDETRMTKSEIQAILRPEIRKNSFGLKALSVIYVAVVAATLFCECVSMYGLRANPPMLTVQLGLTLVTLGFLAYGIHLVRELTIMDHADENLVASLRRRLRFYRTKYEIWLWMVAITIFLLSFAVIAIRHNRGFQGNIDRGFDVIDVGMAIAQILLAYAVLKIGNYRLVQESKAFLSDLENQVAENTRRMVDSKPLWRLWGIVFAVSGTLLLIWVILKYLGMFG